MNANTQYNHRRRTGKVARLPRLIRLLVNTMLDEGFTYMKIVAKLEQIGYPGFFHQNIQRWKDGGYQDHLDAAERRRARMEMSLIPPRPNEAAQPCIPSVSAEDHRGI